MHFFRSLHGLVDRHFVSVSLHLTCRAYGVSVLYPQLLHRLGYAGALHDPVSAIVFCQPGRVDYTVVGGRYVVKEGQLVTLDQPKLVNQHNRAAKRLLRHL